MDLTTLKLTQLGLEKKALGRIFSFIDFGNVNYWFVHDQRDEHGKQLPGDQRFIVDIQKLAAFTNTFSDQSRFYYGLDQQRSSSLHIIRKARSHFIVVTKPIQWIRHYVGDNEQNRDDRTVFEDQSGKFIKIPKCNFDVEICIDAVRLLHKYDTLCLFSGDSDFANLAQFVKRKGKRFILVSSGHVDYRLKREASLHINAQAIKGDIAVTKTPRIAGRGLDIGSASGGQGSV